MTPEEAASLKSFKHLCTCGGYAWSMNGRNPKQPHMDWCPQAAEFAEWREAMSIYDMSEMKWQPIETAPKDGVFLIAMPAVGAMRNGGRRVYEGRWHQEQNTFTSVNGFILLTGASHWMPLPPPPDEDHKK